MNRTHLAAIIAAALALPAIAAPPATPIPFVKPDESRASADLFFTFVDDEWGAVVNIWGDLTSAGFVDIWVEGNASDGTSLRGMCSGRPYDSLCSWVASEAAWCAYTPNAPDFPTSAGPMEMTFEDASHGLRITCQRARAFGQPGAVRDCFTSYLVDGAWYIPAGGVCKGFYGADLRECVLAAVEGR